MNYLKGAFYIDKRHAREAKKAQKDLSLSKQDIFKQSEEKFDMWVDVGTHIAVPRLYGEGLDLPYKDKTSLGSVAGFDAVAPELRDYQVPFVAKVEAALKRHRCVTAKAYTGSGKTVMGLEVARRLGTTVLVIVDLERLMVQWVDVARKVFKIPDHKIGIIQADKADYEGCSIVIAMAQTLYSRDMGEEFYNHFGMCIWDESKVAGAPVMSSILMQVSSRYRLGLDATPHRRDVFEKVLRYQLGEVAVKLEKKHAKSVVRVVESNAVFSWYSNVSSTTGRYISEATENTDRCILLAEVVKRLYETGRPTLGLSDRVEHLYVIAALLKLMGVPEEDIGVYAGQSRVWRWVKDPTPKRKPIGYERGTAYTPVKIDLALRKTTIKEGSAIIKNSKIILATYGVFGKGVDVPHLAAGIELSPKARITQAHGRILRKHPGKKRPIWVTIRDKNSFRAENQLLGRLKEYVEDSNAEVQLWKLHEQKIVRGDLRKLRQRIVERGLKLKQMNVTTGRDGRLTMKTRPIGKLLPSELKRLTTEVAGSRRRR